MRRVEAGVARELEVGEGEEHVPGHGVDVLERQLAEELPLGTEALGVEHGVGGGKSHGQ